MMRINNHQGGPRGEDERVHMAGQGFLRSYLLWLDDTIEDFTYFMFCVEISLIRIIDQAR